MDDIYMVRGDTLKLSIDSIKTQSGNDYVLSETDIIYLDIKKNVADETAIFSTSVTAVDYDNNGALPITIFPEDTENISTGDYFFDVRLYMDDDNIYTIIPKTKLVVVRNVTDIPKGGGG